MEAINHGLFYFLACDDAQLSELHDITTNILVNMRARNDQLLSDINACEGTLASLTMRYSDLFDLQEETSARLRREVLRRRDLERDVVRLRRQIHNPTYEPYVPRRRIPQRLNFESDNTDHSDSTESINFLTDEE